MFNLRILKWLHLKKDTYSMNVTIKTFQYEDAFKYSENLS